MKRLVSHKLALVAAVACSLVSLVAQGANTDPFDFDYEILGGVIERPALIFNDGVKTYIQPRAGQVITADRGHNEGPYVVIDGTPDTIVYKVAGHETTAHWTKANTFIGTTALRAAVRIEPPMADAVTNRLALIGARSGLDTVRSLNATMPIGSVVKALVPAGWTGAAQKDVDLTSPATFATRSVENWMQALDRLMTQTGLYADVDFDTRHVRLHRDPPATVADTGSPPNGPASAVIDNAPAARPSLLAQAFGAQAIRDADDTHTQIRFVQKPSQKLTFKTPDGKSLRPAWDSGTNVVTIERADVFVVSDGSASVELVRSARTVYEFDRSSDAHLEAVFDNDGQTYFRFSDSVIHATVSDVRHMGSGEQKGRYYRFDGTADQFIVTVDGNTLNVTRRRDVKYVERAVGSVDPAPATATAMAKP